MKTAILFVVAILMCASSCGCGRTFWGQICELCTKEPPPDPLIFVCQYQSIEVKKSNAADVLSIMSMPQYELTSQSKSVVASAGEVKKGYKRWLKMAAFDEEGMTVQRKYLLIANETPRYIFVSPWTGVEAAMQMVLESKVLDEPYANENARRIAILKKMQEYAAADFEQVGTDDQNIETAGLLINQGFSSALLELATSPAGAERLGLEDGMVYSDVNMDQGKISLDIADDVATVKILMGSYTKCRLVLPPKNQY